MKLHNILLCIIILTIVGCKKQSSIGTWCDETGCYAKEFNRDSETDTHAIPEPSTILLLGAGMAYLLKRGKK